MPPPKITVSGHSRFVINRIGLSSRQGFSLIELLMVMAVIGLLASFTTLAFNQIGGSRKVAGTLSDLSSLVEFAKTEAMSKNTYVRVGFSNEVANGNSQLVAGAVASRDGSSKTAANNLYPISRVLKFDGIRLVSRSNLSSSLLSRMENVTPAPVSVSAAGSNVSFTMGSGANTVNFANSTITVTPQGEVVINNPTMDTAYASVLELGVQAMKGTAVPSETDQGALWIYGSSGQTRIFR